VLFFDLAGLRRSFTLGDRRRPDAVLRQACWYRTTNVFSPPGQTRSMKPGLPDSVKSWRVMLGFRLRIHVSVKMRGM
jgi:hypothetical protein